MSICLRCLIEDILKVKSEHAHDPDEPNFEQDWRIQALGNPRYGTGDDSQADNGKMPPEHADHLSHMADSDIPDTDINGHDLDKLGDSRLTLHPTWDNIHEDGMDLSVVEPTDDVDVYFDNPKKGSFKDQTHQDDPDSVNFEVDPRVLKIGRGGLAGSMKGVGVPSDLDWETWGNQFSGDELADASEVLPDPTLDPRIRNIAKKKMESQNPNAVAGPDPDAVEFFLDPRIKKTYQSGRETSHPFQYKDDGEQDFTV